MSKKKHKKIDWRAAAEALAKAERPRETPKKIEVQSQEKVASPENDGPNVKGEIKKIGWVAGLLVLIFIGTIILDRTTSLPSVFAGKVMVFLHLEQK